MHAHPSRASGSVQKGVQYRPVSNGITPVEHALSLSSRRRDASAIEMVPSNPNGSGKFSTCHHFIYQSPKLCSFSESEPAHSSRQPLEPHFLLSFTNPPREALVLGKGRENQLIDLANVFRIPRQRSPSKWPPALAKHWSDVPLDKSWELKRVLQPSV